MHFRERNEEAKHVHALVKYSLKPEQRKLIIGKVDLLITAYFDKRPYDSSNICAKLYEDGLKGIVLINDTPKHVGYVATKSEIDKYNPRVEIDIIWSDKNSHGLL